MSRVASVSRDVVSRFKQQNGNSISSVSEFRALFVSAVDDLLFICREKRCKCEDLKDKLESLLDKVNNKKSEASRAVSSAESALKSTPEKIEEKKKNEDGSVTTKKVSNPAHAAAQAECQQAADKLKVIENMIRKIKEAKQVMYTKVMDLKTMESTLSNAKAQTTSSLDRMISSMNSASSSLDKVIVSIEKYESIKID